MRRVSLDGVPNNVLILQPTDVFCHTIFIFTKLNMLISYNPLSRKYWRNMHPQMIFQWSKGIVSPLLKYEGNFFYKNNFRGRWGNKILGANFRGGVAVLCGGLMIRLYQGWGNFTNVLSRNLKTVYLKLFPNHEEIYIWR